MIRKENLRYKVHKIHKEVENKTNYYPLKHKLFYTEGVYPFGKLDVLGEGWSKIYPIKNTIETIKPTEKGEDKYKTLIYENKNEQAMAIMYLDLNTNYHELDVSTRNSQEKTIENIVLMLEKKLGCKWNNKEIQEKGIDSNLIEQN